MMMRYHLGLGVGHVYGYKYMPGTPTGTSQPDSEGAAMTVNDSMCVDSDVDVREGDQVAAHKSDLEEYAKDLVSSRSSNSGSASDLDVDSNESVTSDEGSMNFEAVMYYNSAEDSKDDSESMYEF